MSTVRNTTALQFGVNKTEDHRPAVVTECRRYKLVIDKSVWYVNVEPFSQHLRLTTLLCRAWTLSEYLIVTSLVYSTVAH